MDKEELGKQVNYKFIQTKASDAIGFLYQSIKTLEESYNEIPADDEYLLGVASDLLKDLDKIYDKFEDSLRDFYFEVKPSE